MTEQFRFMPNEREIPTLAVRDYTRVADVSQAIERLVAGLKEDGDEYRMFEILGIVLKESPEIIMPIVRGSISLAQNRLGQDRRSGSSATLLYPIDAAMRVVANRLQLYNSDSLSVKNWTTLRVKEVLQRFPSEIIELSGKNTTSKNLPQRAAHILWLLDQCSIIKPKQQLSFLEIGASGGLILDALAQPRKFREWMRLQGYRSDFGENIDPYIVNPTLGIDLVKPDIDWLQAVILEDKLRRETSSFIRSFSRSNVVVESATSLEKSKVVVEFIEKSKGCYPVIFSCFVFYQLDSATREFVTNQSRSLLRQQGGGLLIVSDIAKYRGFPEKAGGCVSWVEDQDGQRVSPRILLSKSTLTEWEEI